MTFYWLAGTMTIFVIYCKNGDIQKKPKATFCKMCLCLSGMQCCCWCRIKLLLSFPACECLIIFHSVFIRIGSSLVCNLCNKKQIDKYRLNRHRFDTSKPTLQGGSEKRKRLNLFVTFVPNGLRQEGSWMFTQSMCTVKIDINRVPTVGWTSGFRL